MVYVFVYEHTVRFTRQKKDNMAIELSEQQATALIEANTILCSPTKSGYLEDLPQSIVLYVLEV